MKIYNSFGYALFFLLLSFLYSCGNASTEGATGNDSGTIDSNETLKVEVIAIHDEVMPLMGILKQHQKRLSEEASGLSARDASHYIEEITHRQVLIRELDQAYEGMFVWMRQFKPHELDDMDEEEGRAYLLEQKVKVEKVNEDIKSALSRAEETVWEE